MLSNIRDFYFKWQVWEIRTTKPRKNVVVKHIDSSMQKERYQADTVQLSKHGMSEDYKYLFTMVDHFTKYGWIIPLKDKASLTVLRAFKKWITTHNTPMILQTDNGAEFKNKIISQFCSERNVQQIYGVPYNPQHQGAVEAFNRTVQDFLTLAKDQQMDSYNLEDSIADFMLYYNGRKHSTTKVAPYKAMKNWWDKELMEKIKTNTIKRRTNAKVLWENFSENTFVRVSNFTKILDDEYVRFFQPIGLQKRIVKEKWWVVGKVIYNRRNYCKIVITENKEGQELFKIGSIWKIEKKALKISNRK